jgi:hypothetical protein
MLIKTNWNMSSLSGSSKKPKKIKFGNCIISGCDNKKIASRGLCYQHYAIARSMVKSAKLTWDEMVSLKLALPGGISGERGAKRKQFEESLTKARLVAAKK